LKKKEKTNSPEKNLQHISNTAQQSGGIAEKILNALPIGICITNKDGYFTYVNPRYREMHGYEKEELIGKHISMVVPKEGKAAMKQQHDDFMENHYELQGEWEAQRKNGEKFTVLANAAYLINEIEGGPQKMTFVADIDSLSLSTDNLNATVEMLNRKIDAQELAFHISNHDMRNNIGNIYQLADLLSNTQLDKKQSKYVEIIHQLSLRTLELLKMSSDYLKMEKGHYEPQPSDFNLLRALSNEIGAFSSESENRGISFHTLLNSERVQYEEESLTIRADKAYMERMFGNLIGNAVEASPNEAQISVSVETKETLKVSIHNQGAVPEDMQGHFFDKFATSGKEEGTGLGTYIAKLVTELHHGNIHFETSEKEGTTLCIELPGEIIQQ
jgi:PAS domain S-box-containing protein